MTAIEDIAGDPKRARVLDGAFKTFLTYGFARTTMDDIAKAADMSRPALYLLFKNKTDIYRATAMMLLGRSAESAKAALQREGTFAQRAMNAIEVGLIGMMQEIGDSPHGAELLDMKSIVADIALCWRDQLAGHIADAIDEEAARSRIDLAAKSFSAPQLADILLDGLEGMKSRISNVEEKRQAVAALVKVIDLALHA
ncbi:transcriptional regulator [Mesorhizobium sp. Root554]|uniref:TetR/AcrR family transcriptional regulator n=1 Tax=unclassified Mesorhizobium TaxID=325217 RepID=UPI0006FE9B45|nr:MULTISPECIES: TetR/AcrR family transcriptional regulator [unclassified Mesorhizobium]KQZ14786.1 transcriptional regulator [Mesorhizobium sp. Root1471]KQZ37293.1 transcriptional regulator [Mesorhizobium sp. Root554]